MTSGDAKRSVTRRLAGTAMQRGTNMNWVAIARTITLPSLPTAVPRFCSANSPDKCSVFGSIRSTLLGGLMPIFSAVNTIVVRAAAIKTPTPKLHRSSVVRIQRSCASGWVSVMKSAHRPARNEHKDINQKVAGDEQCHGRAGEHGRTEGNLAHDVRERCWVDVIGDLELGSDRRRLVRMHGSGLLLGDSLRTPKRAMVAAFAEKASPSRSTPARDRATRLDTRLGELVAN